MRRSAEAIALALATIWAASVAAARADGPAVIHVPLNASQSPYFESTPEAAIRRARERVAQGDLRGAIHELALYVAAHPDEIAPARFLGDLYYRAGDLKEAEVTYTAILTRDPSDKETHDRLGVVYATEHRTDAAISEFEKSLPGTDAIDDLVVLHRIRGDLPAFRRQIEDAVRADPSDVLNRLELGELDLALHLDDAAERAFASALGSPIALQRLAAYNGLGLVAFDELDWRRALPEFEACLKLDPEYYPCLVNAGAADLHLSRLDEARVVLERARTLEPERPEAWVNLGYLADDNGDWKTAIADYAQAIADGPYESDAYVDIGLDYIEHRLYRLAEAALLKGIACVPYDGRLHVLLGDVYSAEGLAGLAATQYRAAAGSDDAVARAVARERLDALKAPPRSQ